MKHIKHINELFGLGDKLRSKFNKEEDIAKDILKIVERGKVLIERDEDGEGYYFSTSNFEVKIKKWFNEFVNITQQWTYDLYLDNEPVKSSNTINKQIYNKCEENWKKNTSEDFDVKDEWRKSLGRR
jgi:hypothetical protein